MQYLLLLLLVKRLKRINNMSVMQQIIFNCGWVILPNKNCYCDKCAHKYNIIHEPKICVIEK